MTTLNVWKTHNCLDSVTIVAVPLFLREPWSPTFKAGLHRVALRVFVRCFWGILVEGRSGILFIGCTMVFQKYSSSRKKHTNKRLWIYSVCVCVRLLLRSRLLPQKWSRLPTHPEHILRKVATSVRNNFPPFPLETCVFLVETVKSCWRSKNATNHFSPFPPFQVKNGQRRSCNS